MKVTLRLLHQREAALSPDAWFIPGASPHAWLSEISGWGMATSKIALHPVPRSPRDLTPCGVLALVTGAEVFHPSPQVHAYCRVVPGLYIPADGKLEPSVQESELAELCSYQVNIWHPSAGLVGLEAEDTLPVHQLLEKPSERPSNWICPHPGVAAPMGLQTLVRIMPPDPKEILEAGKEDIGNRPVSDLPKVPGEPANSLVAKTWRPLQSDLAGLVLSLMKIFPRTSPTRTWVNDAEDWLLRLQQKAASHQARSQSPEFHRLMDLLRDNIEEGLKYAIPLDSKGSRGLKDFADDLLSARKVEFSLQHLGGGAAAHNIYINQKQFMELRAMYTKAANFELAAGRFRRAAYIFASLLNDYLHAADALRQGRYYHEAVELYRKYLKKPEMAAQCLVEAGLLHDAADLYEELKRYEKAGDVCQMLGDEERAHGYFRMALSQLVQTSNTLAAAELLEVKLSAPDEALELLEPTWPNHRQAEQCLEKRFDLLGSLGRHEDVRQLLKDLVSATDVPEKAAIVARRCVSLQAHYPDPQVRTQAADGGRVVVGRNLNQAGKIDLTALTTAVRGLEPDDDLLLRDSQRFEQQAQEELARKLSEATAVLKKGLPGHLRLSNRNQFDSSCQVEMIAESEISGITHWAAGLGVSHGYLACGFRLGVLAIVQGTWEGDCEQIQWDVPEASHSTLEARDFSVDLLLHNSSEPVSLLNVICAGKLSHLPEQTLENMWQTASPLQVGRPAWLADDVLTFGSGISDDVWVVRSGNDGLSLCHYSVEGDLSATVSLEMNLDLEDRFAGPLTCQVLNRASAVYVGLGSQLCSSTNGFTLNQDFDHQILGMAMSGKHTVPRLVLTHSQGARMVWVDTRATQRIAKDLNAPLALFLPSGVLIVVGRSVDQRYEGRVYGTGHTDVKWLGRFSLGKQRPSFLLPGRDRGSFAILFEGGIIRQYRVQGS